MTEGELQLWRAWGERRDGAAFERLVRPHLRFLSDFARRAGCGADADDAVQTALVELAQARGDRPLRVPLRAWLGRSVLQQARMAGRARARRARHEAAAARPERVEPRPSAHDEVDRALARLDKDARLAVELRYLHDLDYKEIALILRKSEIACRIRVHRAIARLRKELGPLAPAMVAALPLLAGSTDARAALARNAVAAAGTVLAGGLLMATKLKIVAVALLVVAVLFLWKVTREVPEAPSRSIPNPRAAAEAPATTTEEASPASAREGASGATAPDEETEPPLSPGNGCVRGVVRFEDGEPLKGARVSLWGESKVYAVTDERGRFHLHDDWVADRQVYLCGPAGIWGSGGFAFILSNVKMVAGETVRVVIVVKRGLKIAARVLAAATGLPVADAEVTLRRWDGDTLAAGQGEFAFARTDAEGRFAFEHVLPADYSLQLVAEGFEAQYAHWDFRERALPEIFRLEPARRLEIRLENAPPSAIGTKARWYMQRPFEQVQTASGAPAFRQEMLILDGEATIGQGGVLVGDAPPPGRYDFTLWRTAKLPTITKGIELGGAAVEVLAIELEPGSRVEGTLRWPGDRPVQGAEILAGGLGAETDADGRFAFDWLPGAVRGAAKEFRVRLDRAELLMGERAFGPGDPQVVDLVLPGEGSVRFELKGVEADRYGEISIRREGESAPVIERRIDRPFTDPVVLRGLPPGPLRLHVWQAGRSWIVRDLRVDGEAMDLGILEMPRWPRPQILVRVPAGKNLPAFVFVWHKDDPDAPQVAERVELDKEGRGIMQSHPPGHRRISLRGPYGPPVEAEFTVDPDRPQPVDVLLDPE